ncbi:hypothetical protein G6O69_05700 [Pseudenhygromyxa sp. WMMC2535]|uniref:hypothetical protein n=1 Tax=Pseudenhygromyxa sp. WMMC2535 TaxID=2712867 RepID=UPI0015572864|nr:hypothetical protein [Pseudenhygromyxa sp. WMMC2535]NVB37316.1 hypothetical protein [Pseudenhygromyxa sp. WMMC2535]
MRESTRYGLSGALSIVAHGLFVAAFVWAVEVRETLPELSEVDDELPTYEIDFIDFEAKEIEPDAAQGEPEPEQPEPETPDPPAEEEAAPPPTPLPEDPQAEEAAPEPEPEPEPEPKPKFGERRSKITAMVPPNATWTLMLANKRVKKLPFRDAATEIMAPLSDFQLLVDEAGFDVWEDFDFIVMGSPDATDQTQAFVAVQYGFGHDEMRAAIDRASARRGMSVDWRSQGEGKRQAWIGDPHYEDPDLEERSRDDRQFVLVPGDEVAIYVREAFVEQVAAGPDASKGKTSANFVANIGKMRRYTYAEPKAGVQVVLEDIRSMVRAPEGFPIEIPSRAELMWEAAKSPELVIKLDFLESAHAEGAKQYWEEKLEADLRKLGAWDVAGGIISDTKVEVEGETLVLRHQFNEVAARIVLQMIAKEFGKAMRYSKKEAEAAKAERERMWALREGGKLTPSEALAKAEAEAGQVGSEEDAKAPEQEPKTPEDVAENAAEDPAHAPKPNRAKHGQGSAAGDESGIEGESESASGDESETEG